MLGLTVDAASNTIHLSPRLPANWDSLRVSNIRMGDHYLNFLFTRDSSILHWNFTSTGDSPINVEFMPVIPPGTQINRIEVDGKDFPYASFTTSRFRTLQLNLSIKTETTVTVEYQGGISILPKVYDPSPGDRAEGLRIIDANKRGSNYLIELEGLSGSSDTISVWSYSPINDRVENARFVNQQDRITKLLVGFEAGDEKYSTQQVVIPFPMEGE